MNIPNRISLIVLWWPDGAAPGYLDAMGSLQRVEAERRSAQLGPVAAHVELDLTGAADPSRADFVSRTRLEFTALPPGTDTFADLHCVELGAAVLNGKALPADAWADGRLRLSDLREANVLTATATMRYHSDGGGTASPHRPPPTGSPTCTRCPSSTPPRTGSPASTSPT